MYIEYRHKVDKYNNIIYKQFNNYEIKVYYKY